MKQGIPEVLEVSQWERTLEWEGEPVLKLSLQVPKLPENTPGLRRINRCYQRTAQHWRTRWEGPLYAEAQQSAKALREASRPFRPWEAALTFQVTCQTDHLLSLYLDTYEYAGGAHGLTLRQGDTWELASGTPRTLASFFPPRCRWRPLILHQITRTIRQRLEAGESWYYPNWQERLAPDFSPDRFYCTGTGLAIFYPLYTIAPYAEGIPVFPISLEGDKSFPCPPSRTAL